MFMFMIDNRERYGVVAYFVIISLSLTIITVAFLSLSPLKFHLSWFFSWRRIAKISIIVIITLYLLKGIRVIPKPNQAVIEFLGNYFGIWKPGIHLLLPLLMRIKSSIPCCSTVLVPLYLDGKDHNGNERSKLDFTDDSAEITAKVKVQVIDPFLATYQVTTKGGWQSLVEEQTDAAFRGICGAISIDEALKARAGTKTEQVPKEIEDKRIEKEAKIIPQMIKERVTEELRNYGIKFEEVLIVDIKLSDVTERKRREIQEAKKQREIEEYNAQAAEKKGEGEGLKESSIIYTIIKQIEEKTGKKLTPEQIMAYLKIGELDEAMNNSTIIATSEAATNLSLNVATTMAAVMKALEKKGTKEKEEKGEAEEIEKKKTVEKALKKLKPSEEIKRIIKEDRGK